MDASLVEVLQSLTVSKKQIESAAAYLFQHAHIFETNLNDLVQFMQQHESKRKPCLYLVDYVVSHTTKETSHISSIVGSHLQSLADAYAPAGLQSEEAAKLVQVLDRWREKRFVDAAKVAAVLSDTTSQTTTPASGTPPAQCKALYDFEPQSSEELPLKVGLILAVTEQLDENWYFGYAIDNPSTTGRFAISYVEQIKDPSPSTSAMPIAHDTDVFDESELAKQSATSAKRLSSEVQTTPKQEGLRQEPAFLQQAVVSTNEQPQPKKSKPTSVDTSQSSSPPLLVYEQILPTNQVSKPSEDQEDQEQPEAKDDPRWYNPAVPTTPSPPASPGPADLWSAAMSANGDRLWIQQGTQRRMSTDPHQPTKRVVIFDMDETLIQLKAMIKQEYTSRIAPTSVGDGIAKAFTTSLFHLCDSKFHFREIDGVVAMTTSEFSEHDDGASLAEHNFTEDGYRLEPSKKLAAYRLRHIQEQYDNARARLPSLADQKTAAAQSNAPTHEALADFDASTPEALSFKKADKMRVLKKDAGGWWNASCNGSTGWVPSSYLRELDPPVTDDLACLASLVQPEMISALAKVHADYSLYTEAWDSSALRLVQAAYYTPGTKIVMVTDVELAGALAKNLLFKFARYFPASSVYSSSSPQGPRKQECFEKIQALFGKDMEYVAIGDGPQEEQASKACGMKFIPIKAKQDLDDVMRQFERQMVMA
eukprot:m.67631 g.67631  ORF g.67631 m.67631 type:complete len:706 (+) comp12166_c0_seq2:51-2168(+)